MTKKIYTGTGMGTGTGSKLSTKKKDTVRYAFIRSGTQEYGQIRVYTVGYGEIGQNTLNSQYIRAHRYILNKSIVR